jgi:GMP synthase (glutamine-hydrolysing)
MTDSLQETISNEGMVLVYNCMVDENSAEDYKTSLSDKIITRKSIIFIRPGEAEEVLKKHHFTHLIISGSTASSLNTSPWEEELNLVISHFLQDNKAILGICYGHQMLAAHLLGKSCLKKLEQPEFGWNPIKLKEHPLFEGVTSHVFCEIRYDAIASLSPSFTILAENELGIQGFQYKSHHVYGLQFHPDFNSQEVSAYFEELQKTELLFDEVFINKFPGTNTDTDGSRILSNFVNN